MSKKIANTKRSGLSVARVDRNRLDALYYQLLDLVKESGLGTPYEHFFAKPRDVSSEKSIDWYTELNGDAVPLSSLPEDRYAEVMERFHAMVGELNNYALSLRQNGERSGADLIKNALNIPDESYLYLVDDTLVVTCWGFSNAENSLVKDGDIVGKIKEKHDRIQKAFEDMQGAVEDMQGTTESVESAEAPSPETPPLAENPEPPAPAEEATPPEPQATQPEVPEPPSPSTPTTPTPPPATPPAPPTHSWFFPAITGAGLLLAGAAAAWYFLFKDPPDKTPPTTPAQEDMSFLQGSLKAEDMLVNEKGDPVNLELIFTGKEGKGETRISSSRQTCRGTVSAHLDQDDKDKVVMDLTPLTCPDGNNFEAFTILCRRSTDTCEGFNKDGKMWDLNHEKLRRTPWYHPQSAPSTD